jgi:hypothetical protein
MDAVSSLEASQAYTNGQIGVIALRQAAQSEQAVAQMLAEQSRQSQQALATKPPHLGQNVDTFA